MTTDHYNSPLPYRLRQQHSHYVDEAAAEHIEQLEAKLAKARHLLDMAMCDVIPRSGLACDIEAFLEANK